MKHYFFLMMMSVAVSCGGNTADPSHTEANAAGPDSGTTVNQPATEPANAADTSDVQSKGTDKIPSRTGTTGQGNTTVTQSATGSPTGVKDSAK